MWKNRPNMEDFMPRLVSPNAGRANRELIRSVLPKGSSMYPERRQASGGFFGQSLPGGTTPLTTSGGGGSAMYHTVRPYDPMIESLDKQFYPQDRITAARWWRLFYKHDPIVGVAIDMYAEMIVSTFDLIVEDDPTSEIKDTLAYMCESVDILDKLKAMIREYLVIGETIPHCFFDTDSNIWNYIALHNPDYMDVKDVVLANMPPILNYIPDQDTKALLSDGSPESREFRKCLPAEFVSKVLAGQKIRMNPVNCTFIPRKLHPYQTRGTSLLSRMFRILMVEDAVYNSTIATYRRSAGALKVAKIGDPNTGWIMNPSQEAKILDMLTKAEIDPQAWCVFNWAINFEIVGAAERAITIKQEQQVIDGIKLTALGLSKGFISGDANYASSKAGLQVFLRRLLSLRQFIESVWLYPKFFRPICEINGWTKSTPSEISHRYRIKRTAQEIKEQKLLIMPKVQWSNRLDPTLDSEVLNALNVLKSAFNFKISKDTLGSYAGLKWQEEEKKCAAEFKEAKEISKNLLGQTLDEQYQQQSAPKPAGATPPGGAGSGAKPPAAGGPGKGGGDAGLQSAPPGSKGEGGGFGSAPGDGALNTPPMTPGSSSGLTMP